MMHYDWNQQVRSTYGDRGNAVLAARRLGVRDDVAHRIEHESWLRRVGDSWWRGFFTGGTVFGVVWFVCYLILDGWK